MKLSKVLLAYLITLGCSSLSSDVFAGRRAEDGSYQREKSFNDANNRTDFKNDSNFSRLTYESDDGVTLLKSAKSNAEDKNVFMITFKQETQNLKVTYYYSENDGSNSKYEETFTSNKQRKFFNEYFFSRFSNMKAVVFSNITMDDKFAQELEASNLSKCKLTSIIFNNCKIDLSAKERVEAELLTALFSTSNRPTIESVSFDFVNSPAFPDSLMQKISDEKGIKYFKIALPKFRESIAEMVGKVISNNADLENLSICASEVEEKSLEAIAKNIKTLKKLMALEFYLGKINSFKSLNELMTSFTANNSLKETLTSFAGNFDLSLLKNDKYEACMSIADFLAYFPKINSLDISGFSANENGLNYLFERGLENKESLNLLSIDGIKINNNELITKLESNLKSMKKLSRLFVRNCELEDVNFSRILNAISSSEMKQIYADHNKITHIDLAEFLKKNSDLEFLNLQNNKITKAAVKKIMEDANNVDRKDKVLIINCNNNNVFSDTSDLYNELNKLLAENLLNGKKLSSLILAD